LLALGVNLLFFFADADRLDGAANGPVKGGIKSRKRKEGGQTKKSLTKEE
jgi:hypothetical protein